MSTMVKVKTAELTGKALDWAVDLSQRYLRVEVTIDGGKAHFSRPDAPPYSTDWSQGGPLVDEHDVWLSDDEGASVASCFPHTGSRVVEGNTNLIAICRAIVVANLGEEVEVPQELVTVLTGAPEKPKVVEPALRKCHSEAC